MLTSDQFIVNYAAWDQAVLDLRMAKARISTYLEAVGRIANVLIANVSCARESVDALRPDLRRLVEYLDECEDAEKELDSSVDRVRFVVDNDATAKNRGDGSPQPLC